MPLVNVPSPNHDARPPGGGIDVLVFHYTDMESSEAALKRLCDSDSKVSAHYLIGSDGRVFRLVAESRRAWHAGQAFWCGQADINDRSIGIELDNPGEGAGKAPFPALQMAALAMLCTEILRRYPIPARNVVGHSDIAPRRKQDPGILFDWQGLARKGIGIWPCTPRAEPPDEAKASDRLEAIGYEIVDPRASLVAFQRHFRAHRPDGILDAETMGLLTAVLACCEGS
ncbi:MAG: N-acetylmuramoyl-L-alanine amidase [Rhodospirillales bacterium]